ncbi:hypothetical protein [Botrimarina hoheduenensis]|uniref:Uncharacterized protein n=1 Tax=Botrimarina hoheduenensis TaxID=2528000 RepID=A0A5C5VXR1_9BACT|nr:hypothetical protein [Botrimarina hoheduenensis]TWT43224.1 hypothetical protein Pla111_21740 [Botrimarina hoheduenensis]
MRTPPEEPARHTIRLRSAWREDGTGRQLRIFHRPSGLGSAERVFLVWDGPAAAALLNDEPLNDGPHKDGPLSRVPPAASSHSYEVTGRLLTTNRIVLTGAAPEVLQTVRLEILAS